MGSFDISQSSEILKKFPEMDHRQCGVVMSKGADVDSVCYRLLCLEDRGVDPCSFFESAPSAAPVNKTELFCPTCGDQINAAVDTYPVIIRCPSCEVTVRLSGDHTVSRLGRSRVMPSNQHSRASSDPACDYCGMQFYSPQKREAHMQQGHKREVQEMEAMERALAATPPELTRRTEAIQLWEEVLNSNVRPRMDDVTSHARKVDAYQQIEAILKVLFPGATVYLFGSTTTGTSEQTSDIDMALQLDARSSKVSDISVIESLWEFFLQENLPWAGSLEDPQAAEICLRKVTKTRVPIIGYTPLTNRNTSDPMEVGPRSLAWPSCGEAEMKRIGKLIPPGSEVKRASNKQPVVMFPSAAQALTCKLKGQNARLLGIPNVFCTHWDISLKYFGVRNSALLRKYFTKASLKLAAVAVKIWSKQAGVNDPRTGLLSSYSLMIMFVYYLLVKGKVEYVDPASIGEHTDLPSLPDWLPPTVSDDVSRQAAGYLIGFFHFYTTEYEWDTTVISLNSDPQHHPRTKESMGWTTENEIVVDRANSVRYFVCVEDPYEAGDHPRLPEGTPLNLGRKITNHRALFVQQAFRETWCLAVVQCDKAAASRFLSTSSGRI
eukprot:TRINITY_DN44162_c0_g1_i1.p1 TRINITY_DN44162_c0_g1~~TRINITY_DN44162_c0_g1_i1.p1  ORF type:complete len:606 (+),score=158.27 TRINITY_DN44162_c0_g1_i1:172-1989(+)